MPVRRLLALLVVVLCACLPAAAGAAGVARAGAHPHARSAATRRQRVRCPQRRHGHRSRACRTTAPSKPPVPHPRRPGGSTTAGTSTLSAAGAPSATSTSAEAASTAPCDNGDLVPTPGDLPTVEAATLCLVNQVRGQHGLTALAPNARLQAAAVRHNNDMVAQNYFSHTGPGGDTPESRIQVSGYLADPGNGWEIGENIAWGTGSDATPAQIVQAWVNSPEHMANMLTFDYADSGVAVAAQAPASVSGGAAGAIYTQDFGGIDRGN